MPGNCSLGSTHASVSAGVIKFPSEDGSECSSVTSESIPPIGNTPHDTSPRHQIPAIHSSSPYSIDQIYLELQERREEFERIREEVEGMKVRYYSLNNT